MPQRDQLLERTPGAPSGAELEARSARVAGELLRVLRGRRSRPAFSKHVGYRSNVAQRWETGISWPTAARFFELCARLGIDCRVAISRYLRRDPAWLQSLGQPGSLSVAAFLSDLRGKTPIRLIVERTGYNRYSISRWLKGIASPRLPELLCLIDACSRRLPDFVAEFVDPSLLPTLRREWQQLCLAREGVLTRPWSHAVLRGLELPFDGAAKAQVGFVARKVGLAESAVADELTFLLATDQVERTRRGYRPKQRGTVDTGGQAGRALSLKVTWAKLALDRLAEGDAGRLGYSLFAVSRTDLRRIWQLQLDYARAVSAIIAESEPSECVALYAALLLDLDESEDNAFLAHEVPPVVPPRRGAAPRPRDASRTDNRAGFSGSNTAPRSSKSSSRGGART